MKSYHILKKQLLKNKQIKKAYDDLGPEFELIRLLIRKRIEKDLTQAQLARKIGTRQSAISRFESGSYNPSISFLNKMAYALDVKMKISFS